MKSFSTRLLLICLACGCSGESDTPVLYAYQGTLTLDGQNVRQASLQFLPDAVSGNSGPASFAYVKEGTFNVPVEQGLVAGKAIVEIEVYADPTAEQQARGDEGRLVGMVLREVTVSETGSNAFALTVDSTEFEKTSRAKRGTEGGDSEGDEDEED